MPSSVNIKPSDVDSVEKRSKYTVSIIGCGQKGIFYANEFAEAGFQVICTDADPSVTKKVTKGKTAKAQPEAEAKLKSHITKGQISVSGDRKKAVSQSDIIIVAVGAKVDSQKKTDCTPIISACKQIGASIHPGTLVIYGGIAGLGFTGGALKETLENTSGLKTGTDFGIVYSPIHAADVATGELELTIAATDQNSLEAATTILKTITKNVKQVSNLKTAEITALVTVAKHEINRALANELAMLCENANVDYFEVLKQLGSKNHSFWPTIAEQENKDGAYLLMDSAEELNAKVRLATLARQINEDMAKHAVNLTQEGLRRCEKALRRARVAVLDPANQSPFTGLVGLLEQKGAKVTVYNPAGKKESADKDSVKTSLNETVEGTDCIVLLSWQDQFNNLSFKKLKALTKQPSAVVDLVGKIDPKTVETEGFIYCGLGRTTG
jgi:nucleotide sugar dehydrogenase